jgi:chemotaxis protein MotB
MGRKQRSEEHPNHERWLVSYADFITLLFAFFVVMFATAQSDHNKASRVSESVRKALEEGQVKAVMAALLGNRNDRGRDSAMPQVSEAPRQAAPGDLTGTLEALRRALKLESEKGQLRITLEARGLVISLREAAFFSSGDDVVSPGAYASIGKIADAIRGLPNLVRLEGHTDSVPIHNSRFRNNWGLSAARSVAMLELLESRFGLPAGRLAVAGYAETIPVESNETAEGRAHNRRVDIVILNESGARPEPTPPTPNTAL